MPYRDAAVSTEWIGDNAELARAVAAWTDCVCLDTEFVRTNTYYPMPGLYQVCHGDTVYLLDPLAIDEWDPLVELLQDPGVVKVMHACLEDSELIYHHLGVTLQGVFDTQFAQAFVSEHYSLSYARLVEDRLGVSLAKHETRSNWRQRPLTAEQVEYAVEDVVYLEQLFVDLKRELHASQKWDWFDEDMQARAAYQPGDPLEYYRNVKKAWDFDGEELALLQALCAWREVTARELNVPRNRVIWDDHLYHFAKGGDLSAEQIAQVLPKAVARKFTDPILAAAADTADAQLPPIPRPLSSAQGAVVKALRAEGLNVAKACDLAPELICRKRDLEGCLRHFSAAGELPSEYRNWRQGLVGDIYQQILHESPHV